MKTSLTALAAVAIISLLFTAASASAQKKIVAYVPNWGEVAAIAATIDYSKITHINIAFENPINADGEMSFNGQEEALIAKAHESHVQVLVSIGGGSASTDKILQPRYFGLISAEKRAAFAAKLADFVAAHNFDGLDVDIEGPSINKDYGPFIDELARALKPKGKLLTAALSQGYGGDRVPRSALDRLDFVNIMAYDGTGPWNPGAPGQHSSLELAQKSIAYWLGRGLSKARAVLGVPFYGYGFGVAFRKYEYPYSEIVASYPGAENADQVGATIWYNGIPTIKAKAKLVIDQGLAGVMIWSLDCDARGTRSLLTAVYEALMPHAAERVP